MRDKITIHLIWALTILIMWSSTMVVVCKVVMGKEVIVDDNTKVSVTNEKAE